MKRLNRACGGFTLIEVLVALSIFSLSSLAVARLVVGATAMVSENNIASQAIGLAQDTIENLRNVAYANMVDGTDAVTLDNTTFTITWTVSADDPAPDMSTVVVNVLSQSWERPVVNGVTRANDRKSLNHFQNFRTVQVQDAPCGPAGCGGNLSYGINTAFLAGVDDTIGNDYNGGLENYPRFHERWSSRTLVYRGSFVSLGNPLHVDGEWSYGNPVYEAPDRNWDFDPDFARVENLPPLTPKITYVQQRLYTRFYK